MLKFQTNYWEMEEKIVTPEKGKGKGKTIELIENIESSEEYKLHVCLPYFTDIFKVNRLYSVYLGFSLS